MYRNSRASAAERELSMDEPPSRLLEVLGQPKSVLWGVEAPETASCHVALEVLKSLLSALAAAIFASLHTNLAEKKRCVLDPSDSIGHAVFRSCAVGSTTVSLFDDATKLSVCPLDESLAANFEAPSILVLRVSSPTGRPSAASFGVVHTRIARRAPWSSKS